MSSELPPIVAQLTHNFDAWVVGSAAAPPEVRGGPPRDWDLVVPWEHWHRACLLAPLAREGAVTPNSFGGWKVRADGVEIDMWPGDVGWIMQRPRAMYVWHPKSGVRWTLAKDGQQAPSIPALYYSDRYNVYKKGGGRDERVAEAANSQEAKKFVEELSKAQERSSTKKGD